MKSLPPRIEIRLQEKKEERFPLLPMHALDCYPDSTSIFIGENKEDFQGRALSKISCGGTAFVSYFCLFRSNTAGGRRAHGAVLS